MNLLAMDSSTPYTVTALSVNDNFYTCATLDRKPRADLVMKQTDFLLGQADISVNRLDGFILGAGPGSFTGLRISYSSVRAMAQVLKKPVVQIPTLEAIAYAYRSFQQPTVVVQRARKGFNYCCCYQQGKPAGPIEYTANHRVIDKVQNELSESAGIMITGTALDDLGSLPESFVKLIDCYPGPAGEDLLKLGIERFLQGNQIEYYEALPLYLRPSDAEVAWEEKHKGSTV